MMKRLLKLLTVALVCALYIPLGIFCALYWVATSRNLPFRYLEWLERY